MSFDETDFESLHFQGVTFEDAKNILMDEEEGVFLIRDSSRGGYVICVKEKEDVSQYSVIVKEIGGQTNFYVREECPFKNLSSLLSFYKRNIFKTTSLKRPVSSDRVILRRTNREGSERGVIKSEIPSGHGTEPPRMVRRSAPPDMSKPYDSSYTNHDGTPVYAKVVKPRQPSVYTNDLALKVGDIIRVTGKSTKPGMGTGVLNGQSGDFPLVNVEIINKPK